QVVAKLASAGNSVRGMGRRQPRTLPTGVEWQCADLETGDGLRAAVADAPIIIHAASSPLKHTHEIDVDGTRRLLADARAAGASHLIYVSIVGIDRIPYPYYKHKLAAEEVVMQGGVPWTILRATQFHDLADRVLQSAAKFPIALLPTDFQFQLVDSGEVADALCGCAASSPAGRLPDMGGPDVLRFDDIARAWFAARGMRKPVLPLWLPGKIAHGFRNGYHTCPQNRQGKVTWSEWLQRKYGAGRTT
ncbi:MAG: NAD(P)H-binding protein, partial [Chloroflexota bacterium]